MDINNPGIQDGAVTSNKIADGAVTAPKIADGAVGEGKLSTDVYPLASGGSFAYQDDDTIVITPAAGGVLECHSDGTTTEFLADRFGTGENYWDMSASAGAQLRTQSGATVDLIGMDDAYVALRCGAVDLGSAGTVPGAKGPWVLIEGPQTWGNGITLGVYVSYGNGLYMVTDTEDSMCLIALVCGKTTLEYSFAGGYIPAIQVCSAITNTMGSDVANYELYRWGG